MKFYFFMLCFTLHAEGGVWFGPQDGLGGNDDGEVINFMRPRKVFSKLM